MAAASDLVAGAELRVVVVRDVAGFVLELQLAQRAQRRRACARPAARARREAAARKARGPRAAREERPQREGERRDADDDARRSATPVMARPRAPAGCARASPGPRAALAARARALRRVHRRIRSAATTSPTATATAGASHTTSVEALAPRRRAGSTRRSGRRSTAEPAPARSPVARRSRTIARIWLAISDGESATERFWHTTQRSCAATSCTACSSTARAGGCAATAKATRTVRAARAGPGARPTRKMHGRRRPGGPREAGLGISPDRRAGARRARETRRRTRRRRAWRGCDPARSMKNVSGTP